MIIESGLVFDSKRRFRPNINGKFFPEHWIDRLRWKNQYGRGLHIEVNFIWFQFHFNFVTKFNKKVPDSDKPELKAEMFGGKDE